MRLLLEPKLGPAPAEGSDSKLSWKSYHWMMETAWLENADICRSGRSGESCHRR